MTDHTTLFKSVQNGMLSLGLPADLSVCEKFTAYLLELERWNRRFGFVKADLDELVARHLVDSLAGLPIVREAVPAGTVLDFGSGAGFPGLPLAVCCPERSFILCERKAKERAFLQNMAALLGLRHVRVAGDLAEIAPVSVEAVVSRAVAGLCDLFSAVSETLTPGGKLLAYKGTRAKIEEEAAACAALGLEVWVHPLRIPNDDRERHIVEVRRR
ncbi:MAG TPA: 16S rRNA (guanine(527)-N(7))-methyltransferase RsmG [Spirochaetia bacterium]|nr:16S rRNA (guanine(527)-N(7))-methyltransferase RsmG [Spirochaetia bacterium]